jgi:hypothetical protein
VVTSQEAMIGDGLIGREVMFACPGHKVPGVLIDRGHMIDVVLEEVTLSGMHHTPIIRPIVCITQSAIHGDGVTALLGPPPVRVLAPVSFLGLGVPGLRKGSFFFFQQFITWCSVAVRGKPYKLSTAYGYLSARLIGTLPP